MQDPNPGKPADLIATAMHLTRDAVQRDLDQVEDVDLKRLLGHIKESLFDDNFSLRRLRRSGKFPASTFGAFCNQLQRPLKAYITDRKMEGACWLLAKPHVAIWQIAKFAGYCSTAGFDKGFRAWAGCTPREYRQKMSMADVENKAATIQIDNDVFWWRAQLDALKEHEVSQLFNWLEAALTDEPAVPGGNSSWYLSVQRTEFEPLVAEVLSSVLMKLPTTHRKVMIQHAIRCDSVDLFHSMGEKSLEVSRQGDHEGGIQLAEIALDYLASNAMTLGKDIERLRILGQARLANAHRLAGEFGEANRIFASLDPELSQLKETTPIIAAEILALEASLRLFQSRLIEARELINEAIDLCEQVAPCRLLAQCLTQKASINSRVGDPHMRIPDLSRALAVSEEIQDLRLQLVVCSNLAYTYVLLCDYNQATRFLGEAKELAATLGDGSIRHHHQWVEGLIASSAESVGEFRLGEVAEGMV